ncbi:hypothetical protein HYH03_017823 [Edaphochlamys debaryana]|uniref:Uncharacterized protein n=1 Tax=Edaphochlamys debaryana TaxID=47281 RepID=A0A835XHT0_9CHLO|nr:hypothetical protein HYH03_017823 [Edaphochlamys debaryana]|eukprot:KAG2483322.1 hypothetical protein HYH03_017823 [Edaphochlamys debaryana]
MIVLPTLFSGRLHLGVIERGCVMGSAVDSEVRAVIGKVPSDLVQALNRDLSLKEACSFMDSLKRKAEALPTCRFDMRRAQRRVKEYFRGVEAGLEADTAVADAYQDSSALPRAPTPLGPASPDSLRLFQGERGDEAPPASAAGPRPGVQGPSGIDRGPYAAGPHGLPPGVPHAPIPRQHGTSSGGGGGGGGGYGGQGQGQGVAAVDTYGAGPEGQRQYAQAQQPGMPPAVPTQPHAPIPQQHGTSGGGGGGGGGGYGGQGQGQGVAAVGTYGAGPKGQRRYAKAQQPGMPPAVPTQPHAPIPQQHGTSGGGGGGGGGGYGGQGQGQGVAAVGTYGAGPEGQRRYAKAQQPGMPPAAPTQPHAPIPQQHGASG